MRLRVYRYRFEPVIDLKEVEASLVLALFAVEHLHGEAQVRLDARHTLETAHRCCVIDASTPVGGDLNRLFTGFLIREFGADHFSVEPVQRFAEESSMAAL
jgi:hypothetical protein